MGFGGCLASDVMQEAIDSGCWMLDAGYGIRDAGYWILDAGYWMLDMGTGYGINSDPFTSCISYPASCIPYLASCIPYPAHIPYPTSIHGYAA